MKQVLVMGVPPLGEDATGFRLRMYLDGVHAVFESEHVDPQARYDFAASVRAQDLLTLADSGGGELPSLDSYCRLAVAPKGEWIGVRLNGTAEPIKGTGINHVSASICFPINRARLVQAMGAV